MSPALSGQWQLASEALSQHLEGIKGKVLSAGSSPTGLCSATTGHERPDASASAAMASDIIVGDSHRGNAARPMMSARIISSRLKWYVLLSPSPWWRV